jgi:uncharacterized protein (TIGR03086 family)
MSVNLRRYTKTLYGFDHVVRSVPTGAWAAPSPCEGWTARDVLGHVIAVQAYIECCVNGTAPTLNPYGQPGELVGDDPRAAWDRCRDSVLATLDGPGVLDRVVQTFRAQESVDSFIGWNVVDTLAHTWDLAGATGGDDRLDDDLVAHAIAELTPVIDQMRQPPFFGAAVAVEPSAPAAERYLAMVGRRGS